MTSKVQNDSKPSNDETVTKAVKENPGATIEGVAQQAGTARSTASKVLGRLTEAGVFTRHEGGRDGRKRLPDRFTLKGVELPAASGETGKAKPTKSRSSKRSTSSKAPGSGKPSAASDDATERLKAGGLDPLVIGYLEENRGTAPHGPSKVAKALGRSSGAVGNCLVRLTDAKTAKRVSAKPLRYDLAA